MLMYKYVGKSSMQMRGRKSEENTFRFMENEISH